MKKAILVLSVFLLTGCSTTWYKPGATQQEFNADRQECLAEAYREAPPSTVAVQTSPGSNQPIYTNCTGYYNNVSCTSTGGGYIPPSHIYLDQNSSARDEIFKNCMYKNGWSTEKPNGNTNDKNGEEQPAENLPLNWKGDVYLGMLGSLGPVFQLQIYDGRITSTINRCKEPIMLDARQQGNNYLGELSFAPSCIAEITNTQNKSNCSFKFQVKFSYVTSKRINGSILLPVDDKGGVIRQFINLDTCETVSTDASHKWVWASFDFKQ